MKTSAVIVTYNRLEMLKEVITALQNSATPVSHIIVVDNASDEPTQHYLRGLGSEIDYLRLETNIGGAGGFNAGIRHFMENTNDEFVWLMDDDTIPHPDTLQSLLDFSETVSDFGFLASDVRWTDGHRTKMNNPAPKGSLKRVPENQETPVELLNATFVSLLMSRKIICQIGLPISEFFIWGDDIEYTERASRVAPGYFVPAAKVTHKMATNVGSNIMIDDMDRVGRYYNSYRNKIYYGKKRPFLGRMKSDARIAIDLVKLISTPNISQRQARLKIMLKGIVDGLKFKPVIEFASTDKPETR
ncbi:MAG: glycosyltransferase family 2 protein [Lactobacillaceae bacterium]|jgi:GT2 family glycosyltransferase|nr:glycosyltransferase family 2 protein [Lactobacillaceae bacterium]